MVAAIERITGVSSGRDATFWREAPLSARFDVIKRLQRELEDF